MAVSEPPEPNPEEEPAPEHKDTTAGPMPAVSVPETSAGNSEGQQSLTRRLRRPTVVEAGAFVGLVGGIVGLVFVFAPGCEPQPPPDATKATISDVRAVRPVSFRRFLQRQGFTIPPDLTPEYLARRGVMVEFHYEIIGLSGKHLPLAWELSDEATNDLVAAEQSRYELVPSRNDDAGGWAIWILAPRPGRTYYATVTIYKPQGPPYELKHFRTPPFPGFASG